MAINPKTGEKYHIEVSVHTKHSFSLKNIESFNKRKFEDSVIKEKLHGISGEGKYTKTLVVWHANKNIEEESKAKYDIVILSLKMDFASLILPRLSEKHPTGLRNDILRTVELLVRGFEITYGKQKL